ncbi:DUF2393 family protein [Sulfurimonas sp.]|uniref:DUF2393 family protein n=1 Tax=Sulfurimonas sp. TaxID=2022749 RepID=UPI0025F55918|nr:DUF2393 family protein [Sulfurimonas sp.]MBW6489460.1 DUF2393 domain-containing protein [Sulfurimonas sp.]
MDVVTEFIKELIIYDFILFGSLLLFFILFIVLGVFLRNRIILAILIIFFAFITLFAGSFFGYIAMHKHLFKNETVLLSEQRLNFTDAVVVYAKLKNISNRDFKNCKVTATAYKASGNKLRNYLYRLKPIVRMSIIENDICIGDERDIKLIIEPFTYKNDYNISLGADCR